MTAPLVSPERAAFREAISERSERSRPSVAEKPSPLSVTSTSVHTPGRSCTTPGAELDPAEGVYVDGRWAHGFRAAVAQLLRAAWPTRARALDSCGRAGVELQCKGCREAHVVPFRCGARTCPSCAKAGASALAARATLRAERFTAMAAALPWDGPPIAKRRKSPERRWRFVTLTTPNPPDVAARFDVKFQRWQLRWARKAFSAWWRMTPWGKQKRDVGDDGNRRKRSRRDTAAILAAEISPRGCAHFHVLVYGEYVPQSELQRLWTEALEVPLAILDVRAVRGEGATGIKGCLREVLKYATKAESRRGLLNKNGTRADIVRADHAAVTELAFRNFRRVEFIGAIRALAVEGEDPAADDVTPTDLHDATLARCTDSCSATEGWAWVGLVTHDIVHANLGFGRLARELKRQVRVDRENSRLDSLVESLRPMVPF